MTAVIDHAAVAGLWDTPGSPVARDLLRKGLLVESRGKELCPVDRGRLRSSITTELSFDGGLPVVTIRARTNYAIYVHEGRGPIDVSPRVLRFRPKGQLQFIYRPRVSAAAGQPFLRDALQAARG
jgi:hypothetical protein